MDTYIHPTKNPEHRERVYTIPGTTHKKLCYHYLDFAERILQEVILRDTLLYEA
jgi:hypothetical protein